MDIVSSYLSNLMLIVGSLFLLIGAIGLIRMPDVFTRMHAASIMETAGASLIIIGLIINTGFTVVSLKLIVIMLAIFYISSVATHALARACIHDNLKPNATNKESDQ
ncbi:MAG: monovalent cation/H(+) antiporter subunit G [Pseudomonadota bacterium]|nr:sodium:proton antiporter [Rhodobiaceae bacterium]MEC7088353.1 monovalent cation/H(+) antiporter subunit G [Pseudomonadota bacterium]MBS70884.1 sodium:proton antiporter [Rhodobiaceae bacterium]MEC7270370.1 monovalent cation/H(+) antiporter subunit G [Pseudomonadota bacterium]MEC7928396.1 monovalent cation/H(+) antiporter subunit G [Pseudomonadota bacterium]|tara:strand:+ start:141 stop:461 length:321 start_codon:yes stop_codon:yes gene_type:complete